MYIEDTTSGGGTIPTVTDNAFSDGLIPEHLVSVSFEPTTSDSITNGELTFGGTDPSKFTGDITFVYVCEGESLPGLWLKLLVNEQTDHLDLSCQ